MNEFTLGDVLSVPKPEESFETRSYEANGRKWDITIRTDGKRSAERFFRLTQILSEAAMIQEPLKLLLPSGEKFEVSDPGYIANLRVLAEVATSPRFTPEEWGVFSERVAGPEIMEEIFDWAETTNGVTDWLARKLEKLKNENGAVPTIINKSGNRSIAPASKSSTSSRRRHS